MYKIQENMEKSATSLSTPNSLIDPFKRKIDYLRVSVTDRCDFRCQYCMAEDMVFLPKKDLLSLEELYQICSQFIAMGVRKLRLTGGEPLVRRNIMWLIEKLGDQLNSQALEELTLTTNGSQLMKMADALYQAGIRRINISLDSLNAKKFKEITRWGDLDKVLKGVFAAKAAGIKVKINWVALKDINDDELFDIIAFCITNDLDLTFIEVMPMGDIGNEDRIAQYWPLSMVRAKISDHYILAESTYKTAGPARYFTATHKSNHNALRIGFITPLTHNFCESCNRVRLTCTGILYMCLGQNDQADLRQALRERPDGANLQSAIIEAIARKPKGHDFMIDRRHGLKGADRFMSTTGG